MGGRMGLAALNLNGRLNKFQPPRTDFEHPADLKHCKMPFSNSPRRSSHRSLPGASLRHDDLIVDFYDAGHALAAIQAELLVVEVLNMAPQRHDAALGVDGKPPQIGYVLTKEVIFDPLLQVAIARP
jgi:hypothetical protein